MVSVAGSTPPRIVRVRRGAPEECGGHSSGLGRLVSRRPYAGLFVVDASGISQVAWRSIPCLCPAPRPRPSRQVLTSSGLASAAPGSNKPKAPAGIISRGLPHGFSICRLRFTSSVAAAHARLASGWRAAPLPGGSRTLWVALKGFRLHPSSFPGLCLTQAGPTLSSPCSIGNGNPRQQTQPCFVRSTSMRPTRRAPAMGGDKLEELSDERLCSDTSAVRRREL